jgi:hypothetical protein
MAIQGLDYWYDNNQKRFLEQLVRAFSGFKYQTGYNANGAPQLLMVPCTYAETNRQVANILKNNSENMLNAAPRISIWQSGLKFRKEDVQFPGLVESLQVTERKYDPVTNTYLKVKGNSYTVQRLMPRPFEMDIQVDIWTTNLDQKYQLLEQILTIITPSFDIQNSQNPLDWTALTTVYLEDVTLSSKNVPVGTDNEIDVATIKLRVPIWLSPPAKVKAQKIIEQIITNIYDGNDADMTGYGDATGTLLGRDIITPGDHYIEVKGKYITLMGKKDGSPVDGEDYNWTDLLLQYGLFKPACSTIRLYYTEDFEHGPFVCGTLQYDPNTSNRLIWQIDPDTIPANTLAPFNAMIDPLRTFPGNGLAVPSVGTRYLIAADIGPSTAWGNIVAHENDIIEYTVLGWVVSFDSRRTLTSQLVLNLFTGSQLRWTGREWVMNIDATYAPGFWRLKL